MLAASNGHKDVISILIQRGANLSLVDPVSVWYWQCYWGNSDHEIECAKYGCIKLLPY